MPSSPARDARALAPVGVFDSGVGGLTVLRALARALPGEDFLYLGDTARLPYGTKSPESIRRYALQAAALLRERGVKCLVVACNTASAVALDDRAAEFAPVPVLGVVEPGAAAACAATRSGHIAVVATESTVRGGAYQSAIHRRRPDATVASRACPLFVALAEEGWTDGPVVEAVIHRYLDDLFATDAAAHPDTPLALQDLVLTVPASFDVLLRQGVVADRASRNAIIAEMTGEVTELVLADNIGQSMALTLDGLRSAAGYEAWVNLVESFVADGIVNRRDAALPSKETLLESASRERGLPRPVLCVLMGHVKNWVFAQALQTQMPDSEAARPLLDTYFPRRLREEFAAHLPSHPLKREIIATVAVNSMINHAGISFVGRLVRDTKADAGRIVPPYLEVEQACDAPGARAALAAQRRPAFDECQVRLAIEDAIEGTVRARLEGRDTDPPRTLDGVKQQHGLWARRHGEDERPGRQPGPLVGCTALRLKVRSSRCRRA